MEGRKPYRSRAGANTGKAGSFGSKGTARRQESAGLPPDALPTGTRGADSGVVALMGSVSLMGTVAWTGTIAPVDFCDVTNLKPCGGLCDRPPLCTGGALC